MRFTIKSRKFNQAVEFYQAESGELFFRKLDDSDKWSLILKRGKCYRHRTGRQLNDSDRLLYQGVSKAYLMQVCRKWWKARLAHSGVLALA